MLKARRIHYFTLVLVAVAIALAGALVQARSGSARIHVAPTADLNAKSDCGAAGDGTTNDTTSLQNCINTAATSGQAIYFPAGTYKITSALTISSDNISLYGNNNQSASIVQSTSTANTFTISNSGSKVMHTSIRRLHLYYSTQSPTGISIYCNTCWWAVFRDLDFGKSGFPTSTYQHYFKTGVYAVGGARVQVEDSTFHYASSMGMYFQNVGDVYLINDEVNGMETDTTTTGVVFDSNVGGVYATNVNVTAGETGFLLENSQSGGLPPNFGFFTHCLADTQNGLGWDIESADSMRLTNSWAASASVNGIKVVSGRGISISDSRIYNNGNAGIVVQSGASDVTIKNSTIAGNSRLSNGTYPGVDIGGGTSNFMIIGNQIGGADSFGNTQSYAIRIASGASDYWMVNDNNLRLNVTGELTSAGTGTHTTVQDNL